MKYLRTALVAAACLISARTVMRAQLNMITAQEGMSDAGLYAAQHLSSDARLILIGAFGDTTITSGTGPVDLRYDPATGRANAWAYAFYSSELDSMAVCVVIDIPMIGRQVFEGFLPAPPPRGTEAGIDAAAPYLPSDRMAERLKGDTTFSRYRAALPNKRARLVGIRQLTAEETQGLPATFQTGSPTWFIQYAGGRDTAMRCYVSAQTGETICLRASAVAGARATDADDVTSARASSRALGGGRFLIAIRNEARPELALYAVDGTRVDTAPTPRKEGELWTATIDLSDLPIGSYLCRVSGSGWSHTIQLAR